MNLGFIPSDAKALRRMNLALLCVSPPIRCLGTTCFPLKFHFFSGNAGSLFIFMSMTSLTTAVSVCSVGWAAVPWTRMKPLDPYSRREP